MSETKTSMREAVRECIAEGTMTKAEIAEKLGKTVGSVSSQMTYLRWMDNYIVTDPETKILSLTDKDTYEQLEAEKKAKSGSKSKASTRTPAERAIALAKTITNQKASIVKWEGKLDEIDEVLEGMPDDKDALLNQKEARAQIALFEVKVDRNEALAATLPSLEDAEAEVEAATEEAVDQVEASDIEESDDVDTDLL